MHTIIEPEIVSQETIMAPAMPWWKFTYNGKPRVALIMGPDSRGSGCLNAITGDGIRSFRPSKMLGIDDFSTIEVIA